jgi:hypothetical protein
LVANIEEPQGSQLVDELAVHRGLGVEVEITDLPGGGQAGEPGQAGPSAGLGGGDLNRQETFQERGVAEVPGGGVVELGGQCLGRRGQAQCRQVRAQPLVDLVLAHRLTSASSA